MSKNIKLIEGYFLCYITAYRNNPGVIAVKFISKLLLVLALTNSSGFCSSRLLSFYESLATVASKRIPLQSFSSSSLRRCTSFPLTSFSAPKRFASSSSLHSTVKIGNPCIDGIFQHGFESPIALRGFLNAVLGFEGNREIENIEYFRRDMPSADPMSSLGYHFTVDVRCRTKEGQHFLVEMQNDFRDDYHLKSLIEHARMLSRLDNDQTLEEQEKRVENNKKDRNKFWQGIQGLYAVVITNKAFPFSRMKKSYPDEAVMEPMLVNPYELRHIKQLDRHYGDVPNQIVLLMLDNLKKKVTELSLPIERWAYLLKDSSLRSGVKKITEIKEIEDPEIIAGSDPSIREFIERVDVKHLPQEVRDRYMRAITYYNYSIIDIEEKAGISGQRKMLEKLLGKKAITQEEFDEQMTDLEEKS